MRGLRQVLTPTTPTAVPPVEALSSLGTRGEGPRGEGDAGFDQLEGLFKTLRLRVTRPAVDYSNASLRRWLPSFDSASAVVFVASLADFDQRLFDDERRTQLDVAIDRFDRVRHSRWLRDTPCVLLLEHRRAFEEGVHRYPQCDHSYEGDGSVESCLQHVRARFTERGHPPRGGGRASDSPQTYVQVLVEGCGTLNTKFWLSAIVAMVIDQDLCAAPRR